MDTSTAVPIAEATLLVAARHGDEQAFERLLAPHRRELHVHCYRVLGSLHDTDDALQETLVRAWRGLGGFEPRAPLRAWLYSIATNVCLRALERRRRAAHTLVPAAAEVAGYLQPYPDRLLEGIPAPTIAPDAAVEERESIGLAFVSVMQLLPPRQRVALVLRDVLGWPASDVAVLLGGSVASVNSALQRARERLERERLSGALAREHAPASTEAEARVLARFYAAWEAVDVDGLVDLLTDDALMTMPPEPLRVTGSAQIGDFFRTVPAGGALERIRLRPTSANGQPAFAAYLEGGRGFEAYGVMVFALDGESISSITGFAGDPSLFPALGLPPTLES